MREFASFIGQRLMKSAVEGKPCPYTMDQMGANDGPDALKEAGQNKTDVEAMSLPLRCSVQEHNAKQVERQVNKSASAMAMQDKVGQVFDGIVTGTGQFGTFARLPQENVEGKVQDAHAKKGDHINVKLTGVDIGKGFINFQQAD